MTIKLELTSEQEAQLCAKASAQGMTLDRFLTQLVEKEIVTGKVASEEVNELTPQERARRFREWAESHSDIKVVLSDYAMSRESMYEDRD